MSGDRRSWRSLEELSGDPRARAFAEREFPEGASDPPDGVSRRTVLQLLGASLSMAGLAGCRRPVEEIVPYVEAPLEVVPGVPRHYATSIPRGLDALGVVVASHEGRPQKIEGNELHPSSLGSTDVWAQAALLDLYDPDRAQSIRQGGEDHDRAALAAFWAERDADHRADGGARLAVLCEPSASPTTARLKRAFLERFPRARWVAWEPAGDENVLRGAAIATGKPRIPAWAVERAAVILALDSDFLFADTGAVRNARGFADGRRVHSTADGMNRLYAVEGVLSVTGSNADHRLRLDASRIPALVAALAAALAARGLGVAADPAPAPDGVPAPWLDAVADDLMAHRGAGLIVAGPRQPPEVHATVLALNAALGNAGVTVSWREPLDADLPDTEALVELSSAMRDGKVDTLVVLGGNPVYTAPADLEFRAALDAVPHRILLGSHRDETCDAAAWHVPRAHFLEAWSDTRAADGTPAIVQPLILPLFGAMTDVELLGLVATGTDAPGHDLVRETWRGLLGAADFERRWHDVLRDGVLAQAAAPAAAPSIDVAAFAAAADLPLGSEEGLELVFVASPSVRDGRHANNGWLQELPDPITKMTWDNAALVSPATAAALGVANEDRVRVELGAESIELPVWIVPGQADRTVAVALGYGRTAAGRVGNGVGSDAYRLRTTAAQYLAPDPRVERVAGRHEIAQTQDHGSMEGRPIVREATLDGFRADPGFASRAAEVPVERSMWTEHRYDASPQWGMAIDLNACVGCNACVLACQSENNVPVVGRQQVRNGREMHWIRIDRYFVSDGAADPDPAVRFQPVPCMQCENAPCEQVCPVAATVHDAQGLNVMVYNRCIGTRYCSNNCPYKVRRFNFFNYTNEYPEILKLAQNPDVTVRSRGVMEKCTYCVQRITAARVRNKLDERAWADGDVRTACQQACPTRAISFGDVLDPQSEVSRRKAGDRNYALLEELYTRPRTTYLARLRNPNPVLEPASRAEPEGEHA